jgi:hypothetical protein
VNSTMTLLPVEAGSASVFLANNTAVLTYAGLTRRMFAAGIAAHPDTNPLFTANPVILSLKVVKAVNGFESGYPTMGVTFNTKLRVFANTVLTDANYVVDIKWGPYFLDQFGPFLTELAGAVPSVFDMVGALGMSFSVPRPISDPSVPTRAPVRTPTRAPVRPPTRAPVRSPTRAPVRPPTRAPVRSPSTPCRGFQQSCSQASDCCSNRCIFSICQRRAS